VRGLGTECGVGDCCSAVSAEGGGGVDLSSACIAASCAGCGCDGLAGGSENLAGDVHSLHCVVLADSGGHEEGFDPGDDHGDACPREDEIDETETVAAEVEVMDAETAEEDCKQDADELVFAGALVFGEEPGSLMIVHVGGVVGIDWIHGVVPRDSM